MSDSWRERRRAELAAPRSLELLRLVLLYREARGLDLYEQLPAGLSFSEMIDAIVEHESEQLQRAAAE
jgi:hypothetical protein